MVLIPSVIVMTNAFGFMVDTTEVNEFLSSTVHLIAAIATTFGSAWATWGALRKIIVRLGLYK
jgi:hypothetical protein